MDRPTLLNVGELFNVIVIDIFSISVDSVIVVKARSESQARVEALHQRFYFSPTDLLLFYSSTLPQSFHFRDLAASLPLLLTQMILRHECASKWLQN